MKKAKLFSFLLIVSIGTSIILDAQTDAPLNRQLSVKKIYRTAVSNYRSLSKIDKERIKENGETVLCCSLINYFVFSMELSILRINGRPFPMRSIIPLVALGTVGTAFPLFFAIDTFRTLSKEKKP